MTEAREVAQKALDANPMLDLLMDFVDATQRTLVALKGIDTAEVQALRKELEQLLDRVVHYGE